MKKKLLFVIESLVCAGAEKSLVTLLNVLDYSKYEVDLQLFSFGGEFEALLPSDVKVLPALDYFERSKESLAASIKNCFSRGGRRYLLSRIKYSVFLRIGKHNNPEKAVLFWKAAKKCFEDTEKEYDAAVAYAQGTPTFYVADCVRAKKKFAWVNSIYKISGKYRNFASERYGKFDNVSCVSESGKKTFEECFPEHGKKAVVIYDINDANFICRMSEMDSEAMEEMKDGKNKLLTVGRFAVQKGYDIALEACRILKERNVDFRWYVLGRGALENEIKKSICEKGIEDRFILLGTRSNPYPYYKEADIYVQTSKFEGFGLAIAEARMLNVPVVTTNFDAVYAQMINGENGLVTDMDAESVADGIEKLISDEALYEHIREYQSHEKKGNPEETEKFDMLIEGLP